MLMTWLPGLSFRLYNAVWLCSTCVMYSSYERKREDAHKNKAKCNCVSGSAFLFGL